MKTHWIEVDDEVIGVIRRAAEAFTDSPNDALRKMFELGPAALSTCAERPISRRPRPGWRKSRAADGELVPQSEYELPVLRALSQLGGAAPAWQVVEAVKPMLADRLGAADFGRMANGEERWENRARFARLRAVERGFLRSDSRRGIWELTDEGIARLGELEADQQKARPE
ncbi:MAG: hypothetical protein E6G51_06475 [Actinobacteria bacterium]|nr:MAG: hypothetical protein E6G51_06475 [Actinomycetota bacterium]